MVKRVLAVVFVLVLLGAVFGGLFGWKYYQAQLQQQKMAAKEPPPVTVTTTEAVTTEWQPELKAVGTLRAVKGVTVSPEVAGRVTGIDFRSGEQVAEDDLLVTLNTDTEEAEVRRLQAEKDLAETQLRRQRELLRRDQTSQSAVDEATAQVKSLTAQIDRERSLIAKKRIRAPFEGVIGIRHVDLGEYVSPGASLVTLQALQPLYVDFNLPQQQLDQVREGLTVHLTVDTYSGRRFTGKVSAIDPEVAQETRNFAVRATLPNAEERLRPGMFADVAVQLPRQEEVVTLPQTAIVSNPFGDSVFLVQPGEGEESSTVTKRFVRTGARRGDQVAISQGVEPGQTVVTSGQLKLQESAAIRVNNEVTPDNDPSPTPPNR